MKVASDRYLFRGGGWMIDLGDDTDYVSDINYRAEIIGTVHDAFSS